MPAPSLALIQSKFQAHSPCLLIKQNRPNNLTNVVMGLPMKPWTTTQGGAFAAARQQFLRKCGGGPGDNSASQYTEVRAFIAVGQSSTNPSGGPMAFAQPDKNTVKTAIRRVRSGGCVAPKKCSANNAPRR